MRKWFIVVSCILCLGLFGCSEIKPDSPQSGEYATQNKTTSLEYSMYMNKQITVYINQISSRMAVCKNIVNGSSADNEADLAKESVKIMQDVLDEVTVTNPATTADDDREMTLKAMQTAIEHMNNYAKDVEDENNLEGYSKDFENDFNQLTGLANLYYQ